jgi:hypothetical protein
MKKAFIYSLKVWQTAILIVTVGEIVFTASNHHESYSFFDVLLYECFMWMLATLLFAPSWFIHFYLLLIIRCPHHILKVALSLISIATILITVLAVDSFLGGPFGINIIRELSLCVVVICCIWFYSFKPTYGSTTNSIV